MATTEVSMVVLNGVELSGVELNGVVTLVELPGEFELLSLPQAITTVEAASAAAAKASRSIRMMGVSFRHCPPQ